MDGIFQAVAGGIMILTLAGAVPVEHALVLFVSGYAVGKATKIL